VKSNDHPAFGAHQRLKFKRSGHGYTSPTAKPLKGKVARFKAQLKHWSLRATVFTFLAALLLGFSFDAFLKRTTIISTATLQLAGTLYADMGRVSKEGGGK